MNPKVALINKIATAIAENKEQLLSSLYLSNKASKIFCEQQLDQLASPDHYINKLSHEVEYFGQYTPLGNVLVIVSETYPLATLLSVIALLLTDNSGLIKVENEDGLAAILLKKLALLEHNITLKSWSSTETNKHIDVSTFDAVLLAGGDELIRGFRQVDPSIKLIEYGAKLSVVVVDEVDTDDCLQLAEKLIHEYVLFNHQVCSAPRVVFVPDATTASQLIDALKQILISQEPLQNHSSQYSNFLKSNMLKKVDEELYFCKTTAWIIKKTNGFNALQNTGIIHIVVGETTTYLQHFKECYKNRLQTIGYAGSKMKKIDFYDLGFSRICEIGEMHNKPLNDPHDGVFELHQLVKFVS